jgi:hypothetical protein
MYIVLVEENSKYIKTEESRKGIRNIDTLYLWIAKRKMERIDGNNDFCEI